MGRQNEKKNQYLKQKMEKLSGDGQAGNYFN